MQPQRRFLMAGLAGAAVLPPLAAAASSPAPTAQPLHADHAQGRTVLPAAPRRVAVYDLAALDMLLALGIEPVGVPQVMPPAYLRAIADDARYPKIGTLFEPDIEALRATRPDLVLVAGRSSAQHAALSRIAPTLDLSTSTTAFVPSVVQNLLLLGRLFDRQAQAAALAERLLASLRTLHGQAARAGTGLVLFVTAGGIAPQAPRSRFGIVYELAGIEPAVTAADLPPPRPRAPQGAAPEPGSPEARAAEAERARQAEEQAQRLSALLERRNPDWLFVLDRPAATGGAPVAPERLAASAAVQRTKAWQRQQVVHLDAPTWYLVGGGATALEQGMRQISAAFAARR